MKGRAEMKTDGDSECRSQRAAKYSAKAVEQEPFLVRRCHRSRSLHPYLSSFTSWHFALHSRWCGQTVLAGPVSRFFDTTRRS